MIPLIYQEETDYLPRTEQIWIKPDKRIGKLCHISKNLYNEANYAVKKEYKEYSHYMGYNDLYHLMRDSKNFQSLPVQTAQHTLMMVDRDWQSHFEAKKKWRIDPSKFLGMPGLPGYKKKDGEFLLIFTDQQIKNIDGDISFPKKRIKYKFQQNLGLDFLKIKTRIKSVIKELRIIPKGIGYLVDLVYYKEVKKLNLDKDRIVGLDFGVRNIVAIGNNIGLKPIIVKGGALKSINQFYNKIRSEIQSIYSRQPIACILKDKKEIFRKTGRAIQTLTINRNKKIKDVMHKYSRWIIDYCIRHNIGTIVIGYNPEWKQKINLGKITNQNFVQIPFAKFMEMIKYKAEEIGISIIEQEESHTSKCGFLDNEPIEHREQYLGKRISRGLFRSLNGIIINADVQATYNIIKKAIPKAFEKLEADRIEDVGLHPIRINPLISNNFGVNIL